MQTKISFDAGLRHHTDMIGQSFGRINGLESVATNMSSSLKGLQRGHDLTTQRITELEKSLSGGPTSKSMQVELDRIKVILLLIVLQILKTIQYIYWFLPNHQVLLMI